LSRGGGLNARRWIERQAEQGRYARYDPAPAPGAAGIATPIGNQSFRASSFTAYLKNNRTSTSTTTHRRDEISLDAVQPISIYRRINRSPRHPPI
jgi:hypothetical protein